VTSLSFYDFSLDNIHVKHRRGNIPDNDVVTFTITVNQLDRGHGTAVFPSMSASVDGVPASAVPPNNRVNMGASWGIGPLEIAPGDIVHVIYTGTNISDEQLTSLSTKQQDEIELRILSAISTSAVAAITGGLGLVSEAIAGAIGAIGDPVGKFLGFKAQGPCNGPVFSDAVAFSGSALDNLPMVQPTTPKGVPAISFTRTHTDEATHDKDKCGDIAETDITFSVFRLPFISVRELLGRRFPSTFPTQFGPGIRQHGQTGTPIGLKSLLGLRP
jgi:hypothetical protein